MRIPFGGNAESLGAGWIVVLVGALFVLAWFGHFVRALAKENRALAT